MSHLSPEAADWHWLGPDGTEVAGDEWELVAGLSTGAVDAATLVWKRGWAEWVPANRVAELSTAVPSGRRAASREPRLDPRAVKAPPPPRAPPPAPVRAQQPARGRPAASVPSENPRDTLPPSSFGVLGTARPGASAGGPPRPALRRARMPLPTLSDEALHQPATATLRPPNAVPPPPRGMPTAMDPEGHRIEVTATPLPSVIVSRSLDGEVEHFPSSPPPEPNAPPAPQTGFVSPDPERALDSTLDTSKSASKSAQQLALIQASRTTSPDLVHEAAARRSVRNSVANLVERARPPVISVTGKALLALLALAALSGALAITVVVLFMTRGEPARRPAQDPLAMPSSGAHRATIGCVPAEPAARLAAAADRVVPISVATLPNQKLALGFGATKTRAAGLSIDLGSLDAAQVFEAEGERELSGVTPSVEAGALSFMVERAGAGLGSARGVDGHPRFSLGQSAEGLARSVEGGAVAVIWPGGGKDKITEPRVAEVPDIGYFVAFRRGGQFGKVFAGWLGKDGSAKSRLFEIEARARYAGTPAVAVNDRGALVAFAGRETPTAAWSLLLAPSAPLEAPAPARELKPAGVGPSGAISPSIAGLSRGRWLLQWTEGAPGSYRVRIQTLGPNLEPIGPPLLASPKGASAGQGVVWASGASALSSFILTTGGRDELWGATFQCE